MLWASRLDRFLLKADSDDRFMNIKQNALPRTISNHSQVELQCGN